MYLSNRTPNLTHNCQLATIGQGNENPSWKYVYYSHIFFPSNTFTYLKLKVSLTWGLDHCFYPPLWKHRTHHLWSWDASFHESRSSKELVPQCPLEEVESNDPMQKCNPLLLRSCSLLGVQWVNYIVDVCFDGISWWFFLLGMFFTKIIDMLPSEHT